MHEPKPLPHITLQVIEEVQQKLDQIDMNKETQILDSDFDENGEPAFPNDELARLDEMVNRPKWVIPVLPNGELEVLIDASIKLAKKGNGSPYLHSHATVILQSLNIYRL